MFRKPVRISGASSIDILGALLVLALQAPQDSDGVYSKDYNPRKKLKMNINRNGEQLKI